MQAKSNKTTVDTTHYWIGVASRDHVMTGRQQGFAQFCHGKEGPAKRPRRGDWVLYYSSKDTQTATKPYQRFTAIGQFTDDAPTQVEPTPGFSCFRRSVSYLDCAEVDIKPLIQNLSFIKAKVRWGMPFRYGLLEIAKQDFALIHRRMMQSVEG